MGEQKRAQMSQLCLPCDYLSIWRWEVGGGKIKDFSARIEVAGEGVVKGCPRAVKQPDLGKRPTTSALQSPQVCGRSTKLRLFDKQPASI